ncbi:MAG TPA: 50S ribosomal protein L1 [Ignavibacteriales bacterium]|nr:50S ribosomal protein L1 [Ignavibacteriales bacterium]HOL81957.1 50S ribosomal protein L1 [Ignavibacteriales bacterium]HOM64999.1 50S ribosomal protein L1 [Ignavibacteriales bacterium]HPD67269.1 50S ribosomal protein L1 [Ignavibacteriales bacterium]HPP34094.1 50S ribosomal protein L1 [Ignavibacteriales bacterium]
MKVSKRVKAIKSSVDTKKEYRLSEAIEVLKQTSKVKFVETLEVAMRLGVDPRHADQMIRGSVVLPHGTGKTRKLLVITKGENVQKALDAGADWAGFEEYIEKIKSGWFEMDVIVATPDVMAELGKIGKLLGPKGLMPNPKSGTVTTDVVKAVKDVKAGKIEFRVDKTGIIHAGVGKLNFETDKLVENSKALISTIIKLKPTTAKGQYVKSVFVSSTMGPGLKIAREDIG